MRIHSLLKYAVACGSVAAAGLTFAQQSDSNKALLDLLVKKGLISQDEAGSLQREAAAQANSSGTTQPTASMPSGSVSPGAVQSVTPAGKSPLSFRIGGADFTPLGFLDFTTVFRSTLNGGDIGSGFGSIPYSNTAASKLSETRLSAKNSRLGLRIDSAIGETKVLGYLETDFLGNAATNINVASNSDVLRMRNYFVDIRRGEWELLAGQDWSMLTPNRKGISPIPGDIFYSQNVDTNYQVGLIWGRTPQLRLVYHATDELTFGVSAENPDQYVGSALTLPSAFSTSNVDIGSSGTATPNVIPDLIGKIAYDTKVGGLPFHADLAGLVRYFKVNTFSGSVNADSSTTGYGASLNTITSILPNFQIIENAFMSKGGGRYVSTGLGPDFVVNPADADGKYTLTGLNAYAGMLGFEWDVVPTSKVFGYYGVAYYGRKYTQLANGSYVGYGYIGSPNSQNRKIDEYTIGESETLWKNPQYGDLKLMSQISYLDRAAWYVAPNAPANAHNLMVYVNLRYDLP